MFGRIKNLFRRRTQEEEVAEPPPSSFPPREFHPGYIPGARPPVAALPTPAQAEAATEELEQPSIGDSIRLSLKPVLLRLPDLLKARVRQPPVGVVQISIPLQKVLTQLQQGSVKISFGELRQASPAGVFAELSDQDQTSIELPLAEILSQLRPEQLPRRAGQRKVEVPEAVSGLFGAKGEPLTQLTSGWPDAIKEGLVDLPDATVALPKDELEQALKRGKIAFPWKRIRPWIMPLPPPTTASELDDTPLELPLPVIAPLFIAQRRSAPAQKKYTIADHIPDVLPGRGRAPSTPVQVATP